MARNDTPAEAVGRFLRRSEKALASSRATPRRGVLTTALLAGVGAAAGYGVSTFLSEEVLAAAIGAAAGTLVALIAASVVSNVRMRRATGFRASVVTLVLTSQRLLVFRQSWLNNRALELLREYPRKAIASIEVGPTRFISPHPVTVTLEDGGVLDLESAKYESPGRLAEVFEERGGE
jgi:hypothetical protein